MQIQTLDDLISKMITVGTALTGVLTIVFTSGVFTIWSMLVGSVLLLLLLAYSKHGDVTQTRIEHVLTSVVFALSSLLLLGWLLLPFYQILGLREYSLFFLGSIRLSITWAVFAFALWLMGVLIWMRIHPRQRWPKLFQNTM